MTILKYDEAVKRLVSDYYDGFDIDDIEQIIENGLKGVRQMANEELIEEFAFRFDEQLALSDPDSNPNTGIEV